MDQKEAVAVLRTWAPSSIDGAYSEGTTTQGRSWARLNISNPLFEDLPPPQEVARCVLTVSDDSGREIEVVLGPGGVVSGKRLSPGVWQERLHRASRALGDAATDLASGSWWGEQLRKACRSLQRRRYAGPCLAAAFLLVSVWVLRRRRARYRVRRAEPESVSSRGLRA
jgi:hypothetical protein